MVDIVAEREEILPPPSLLKRVSWGAIFAGAVVAVAIMVLLSLLGLGIGFSTLEVGEPVNDVPVITAIWWAVTSIIATGAGAFVAGRLAGIPNPLTGMFHGAAVWAVSSLVVLWFAASTVGFAFGLAGQAVQTTAKVAGSVAATTGRIAAQSDAIQIPTTPPDVNVNQQQVRNEVDALAEEARPVASEALDMMASVSWYMFLSSLAGLVAALMGAGLAGPTLAGSVPPRADGDIR